MDISKDDVVRILGNLTCTICYVFPKNEVFQCSSGHPVCAECFEERKNLMSKCTQPECHGVFQFFKKPQIRCRLMESLLPVVKPYTPYLWGDVPPPDDLQSPSLCQMLGYDCTYLEPNAPNVVTHLRECHGAQDILIWDNFMSEFYKRRKPFKFLAVNKIGDDDDIDKGGDSCHFVTLVRIRYEEKHAIFSCVTCQIQANDSCQIRPKYAVQFNLQTSEKVTLCKWSGLVTNYEDILDDVEQPLFRVPLKFIISQAFKQCSENQDFNLNLQISIKKGK